MVVFNFGYTAPINRPGQSVLTIDQVWAGLQRKVRHAEEFVPLIIHCEVVKEEGGSSEEDTLVITRTVKFLPGKGPKADGEPVQEVVRHYPPCRVDFFQEDGTKISNYVTQGPSGEKEDLFMTYVFEWRFPQVEPGSEKAKGMEKSFKETAKIAVESSIETIRRLVAEGKI
ncbi:DUF1857-domain-containing protein [Echria macrotheca]|uniref:DUF1857-domain-containing protein n=1 Tax=Echria macrotheca TaxID=438768 RepID=A0AAJ0BBJ4_9PEZI|nr:DUF1857-domain-containing protein [Echria macrotheca]